MTPRTQFARRGVAALAMSLAFLLFGAATWAATSTRKRVGRPEFHTFGGSQISPDSRYLVFTARVDEGDELGLWSKPLTGGAATRLDVLAGTGWTLNEYAISPDAAWVVYVAEREVDDHEALLRVPIAGPASATIALSGAAPAWPVQIGAFTFTPAGDRVLFTADLREYGVRELFRVPIDGGALTRLSGTMVSNGDVHGFGLSPDGAWVVYRADQVADRHDELYSVPVTGTSSLSAQLNHAIDRFLVVCMPSGDTGRAAIDSFQISPDSDHVVYVAESIVNYQGSCDEVHELYSAPIDGSAAGIQIQDSVDDNNEDVGTYQIGPNSDRVVYLYRERRKVGTTTYNVNELYRVPIAGGSSTKLSPDLLPSATIDLWNYEFTPDEERVVFVVDMGRTYPDFAVFSVPFTGTGADAVEISGPMGSGGAVYAFITRFKISPDGQQVIYRADQDTDEVYELYLVPIAGPQGASVKISGHMQPDGDLVFEPLYGFSPDGQWVTYVADQETKGVRELFIYGEGAFAVYLPLVLRLSP